MDLLEMDFIRPVGILPASEHFCGYSLWCLALMSLQLSVNFCLSAWSSEMCSVIELLSSISISLVLVLGVVVILKSASLSVLLS